jgi:hypothetical protein
MRINWDDITQRPYAQGISQGVLYPGNAPGVAWNGLISVNEGGETDQESRYIDGQRYQNRGLPGVFSGTISAYTYPDELEPYIGINSVFRGQNRDSFGFSYRTNNELHLVYNALTAPAKNTYATISDKPSALTFDWDFTTTPVEIPGGRPSSHVVIMVDQSQPGAIADLEALIYGTDTNDPVLPDPADIIAIFESYATLKVTDNGDGSFTITDSGTALSLASDTFTVNWPSVIFTEEDYVYIRSWDFENDVVGWNFYGAGVAIGTITQSNVWSHDGVFSCLVTITTQGGSTNEAIVTLPIGVGQYLEVVATLYSPTDLNGVHTGVDWKQGNGTYISSSTGVNVINLAANVPQTISYRVGPAPSLTGEATLIFNLPPSSPIGTLMYIDDVSYFIRSPSDTYKISSL